MKKRLTSILLTAAMVVSLLPVMATPAQAATTVDGHTFDKEFTSSDNLPSGSYYLTRDIEVTGSQYIRSGTTVYLDLNGHSIIGDSYYSTIDIEAEGTLYLYDGVGGGKVTKVTNPRADSQGYGVSTFGGGVCVKGTFHMYGGWITGNHATRYYNEWSQGNGDQGGYGGGVYVARGGTFNMYGGKISGNTCYRDLGNAVYVGKTERSGTVGGSGVSTFLMTGSADISGDGNDIYFYRGSDGINATYSAPTKPGYVHKLFYYDGSAKKYIDSLDSII